MAKASQAIRNWEIFKFLQFNLDLDSQIIDSGFTITEFKRKYGGCYCYEDRKFRGENTFDNCPYVTVKFEASKTKRARLIFQADVDVLFDNIGYLYINNKNYVNNNVLDLQLHRYLNKASANSSFNLVAHYEDDSTPDTGLLQVCIKLYYR